MNLLLLQYNNYLNRTIKKESTIDDYKDEAVNHGFELNVNFNPNDGVTTEQVINWNNSFMPDYIVCFDAYNNIDSRWFIIKNQRLRNGQYRFSLKRDTIVDYFNQVITAPCFIEKAKIKSTDDVTIYNSEGLQLNQIKKSETLLKDKTGKGWLVGYIAPNTPNTNISVPSTEVDYIYEATRAGWEFHDYETNDYKYARQPLLKVGVTALNENIYGSLISLTPEYNTEEQQLNAYLSNTSGTIAKYGLSFAAYVNDKKDLLLSAFFNNQTTYKRNNPISSLNGKYIYFADEQKFYQITVTETQTSETYRSTKGSDVEVAMNNIVSGYNAYDCVYNYPNPSPFISLGNIKGTIYCDNLRISLSEVSLAQYTTKISATAKRLSDAPYKMFAIPYGQIAVGTSFNTLDEKEALNVACSIADSLGGTNNYIYDLQLLPYCPNTEIITTGGIDITGLNEGVDFEYVKNSNNDNVGIILYNGFSYFSFEIDYTLNVPSNVVDYKVMNEAKMHRLMSPNASSQFDFKLTKTGSISKINVDCTYKPYSPYIHLNPNWNKLYGQDFNDYRGLICQGDFSVPVINDQWKQYQINNKNYLNAFNRQTDSLELQYEYQRLGNILGAGTGALSAGVSGATTGFLAGGPIGAAIGGAVGFGASLAGGIADVAIADRLHQDQMSLRKDQFNYSLQNIQARPQTLAKTSAFDYNNKIFPLIEEYDCDDQEKEILKNKMIYEGMTIMKIATIQDYLSSDETYIRGNIIKVENISGDYHLVDDIKNEIAFGIRVKE